MKSSNLKWLLLAGLIVLWIVGAVGVGMTVYSNPTPSATGSTRLNASVAEVTASVFTVVGGLSVILTLYFNIWASIEARQQRVIESTFALLKSWDDAALLAARKWTRELGDRHAKLTPEQLVAEVNGKPDLRQSAILLFNFIEQIGMSIQYGRVDAEIIRRSLGITLTGIHQRFHHWIVDMDRQTPGYSRDIQEHIDLIRR